VKHLANALSPYCVYIGELNKLSTHCRTLEVYVEGNHSPNFEFELAGTAAGEAVCMGPRGHVAAVRSAFPLDGVLKQMGAESFVAVPLFSSHAQCLGLIGAIYRQPQSDMRLTESILEAFAARASAELERKQSDQALLESEERHRAFIAASPNAMWRIEFEEPIDLNAPEDEQIESMYRYGYLAECNEATGTMFGTPVNDLVGARLGVLVPRSDPRSIEDIRTAIRAGYQNNIEVCRTDNSGNVVFRLRNQWGIVENGKLTRIWITTRDITNLKRTEEALRKSELLFRRCFERGPIGITVTSPQRTWFEVNQRFCELLGYSGEELLQKSWDQVTHPDDLDRDVEEFRRVMAGEKDIYRLQKRLVRKDGQTVFADVWGRAVRRADGSIEYLIEDIDDLTVQKESEFALKASERQMQDLLESVHLLAVVLSVEGKVTFCNDRLLSVTGLTREELLGANWFATMIPEREQDKWRTAFESSLSRGDGPFRMEVPLLTKGGARLLISWDCILLRGARGEVTGTASLGKDITEEREHEAQLHQSQRMEGIGRLAGGVAHDFNNVMTVILGYADLLLNSPDIAERVRAALTEIKNSAEGGAAIARQLLTFSRVRQLHPQVLNLNNLINECEPALRWLFGGQIGQVVDLDPKLKLVEGDAGQIQQILVNLATNARDAMASGGTFTIRTCNIEVDQRLSATRLGTKPGEYVRLTVSDTGVGMAEDVRAHVFEPFFTTKERTKGTGLGLSTVYNIVRQSAGHISVDSTPGEGTTLEILFPAVGQTSMPPANRLGNELRQVGPEQAGTETILVVDDLKEVRAVAVSALRTLGYTVLEADSGAAALSVVERDNGPIHLALVDVMMPEMNGIDLAKRLKAKRPGIKILHMSGYNDDVIGASELSGSDTFLPKPFDRESLGVKIRDVLDRVAVLPTLLAAVS
jgi:PAS domain S-box-containing protein